MGSAYHRVIAPLAVLAALTVASAVGDSPVRSASGAAGEGRLSSDGGLDAPAGGRDVVGQGIGVLSAWVSPSAPRARDVSSTWGLSEVPMAGATLLLLGAFGLASDLLRRSVHPLAVSPRAPPPG